MSDMILLFLSIAKGFIIVYLVVKVISGTLSFGGVMARVQAGARSLGQSIGQGVKGRYEKTQYAQRRQLAKDARERANKRTGLESYARRISQPGLRGAMLRRRAGGFTAAGREAAFTDMQDVINKQFEQDTSKAKGIMSLGAARAIEKVALAGGGQEGFDSILAAANSSDGKFKYTEDGKDREITLTAEDRQSINNLKMGGFLKAANNRIGATAALETLTTADFLEGGKSSIEQISRIAGDDNGHLGTETAGLMTRAVSKAASQGKYKNFAYGALNADGSYTQYIPGMGTKDGISIVASGLQDVPKEMFDDNTILGGIADKTRESQEMDARRTAIIDIARQTKHIDKDSYTQKIAAASGIDFKSFKQLQQAIQMNSLNKTREDEIFASAALTPVASRGSGIQEGLRSTVLKRINNYNLNSSGNVVIDSNVATERSNSDRYVIPPPPSP